MRKNILGKAAGLGLAGLVLGTQTGCTTTEPIFDPQGRYVGERQVDDTGRTMATLGVLNGGLLGLAMQGMGNELSRQQQQNTNQMYRQNMQMQVDALAQREQQMPYANNYMADNTIQSAELANKLIILPRRSTSMAVTENASPVRVRPKQSTSNAATEIPSPVRVRLSSTMGIAPLLVSYSAAVPDKLKNEAYFLWTDNGEPMSNSINGQKFFTEPGKHEIEVFVTMRNGQEYRASSLVEVLKRITSKQ